MRNSFCALLLTLLTLCVGTVAQSQSLSWRCKFSSPTFTAPGYREFSGTHTLYTCGDHVQFSPCNYHQGGGVLSFNRDATMDCKIQMGHRAHAEDGKYIRFHPIDRDSDARPFSLYAQCHNFWTREGASAQIQQSEQIFINRKKYTLSSFATTETKSHVLTCDLTFDLPDSAWDRCPDDPDKTEPGVCGCGSPEYLDDSDGDGTADCLDQCAHDPNKTDPGFCGCHADETGDSDSDGTPDCSDYCTYDPEKTEAGACGCGVSDHDSDGDGTPDCNDACPGDPFLTATGSCQCGDGSIDSDSDGTPDCADECAGDPMKSSSGICGCHVADTDTDGDSVPDCHDSCPEDPYRSYYYDEGCGS